MPRIALSAFFMLALAALVSCGPAGGDTVEMPPSASPEPGPVINVTPTPEPVTAPAPRPQPPDYALAYKPYELVDVSIPAAAPYNPELKVFPLINSPALYKSCLSGSVGFVDGDGERIPLHQSATTYYPVFQHSYSESGWVSKPQCFVLSNGGGKAAVMRLDGTMATGFDYDIKEDAADVPEFQVFEGFLVVNSSGKAGLLDIRSGKLSVACGYDRIELYSGAAYAEKGGSSLLLGLNGETLLEFGEAVIGGGVEYSDSSELSLPGSSYIIHDAPPAAVKVYRTYQEPDITIFPVDKLKLLVKNRHEEDCVVTVVGKDGAFLFAARGMITFWMKDGGVIVDHDGIMTAITPDERVLDFNYAVGMQNIYDAWFADGAIHAKTALDYNLEELLVIKQDGSRTSQQIDVETSPGSTSFRETDEGFEAAYMGSGDSILIPYGLYDDFYELDSDNKYYVLAYIGWGTPASAVYDKDGTLLIQDLYGVVDDIYVPDRLVVYTSPESCGFLSRDGTFTPIPDVPAVTTILYEPGANG